MSNGDLFYICGAALTASAVIVTFLGLRMERFPGRLSPLVTLWFVALVGATSTFGVLHSKDEEKHDEAALHHANEEAEGDAADAAAGEAGQDAEGNGGEEPASKPAEPAAGGPGDRLDLAADPAQIAYDTTRLTSRSGEVTIEFDNPAAIEHDVAIEQGGETIAKSETITEGRTSLTAELSPGEYTFLCTVPGHAEAGMQGTLTVK